MVEPGCADIKSYNLYGRTPLFAAAVLAAAVAALPSDLSETSDTVSITYGTLADARDGKRYKTAEIGGRAWMAENLNYAPKGGNSWCYKDNKDSCDKYGRLYDWEAARAVCPSGWHLPSAQEWDELTGWVNLVNGGNAAKMLVTASGWNKERGNLYGAENDHGFSALPGGLRNPDGKFVNTGYYGVWWTDTEEDGDRAYHRLIAYDNDTVTADGRHKKSGYSVRCVMDEGGPAAYDLLLKATDGGTAAVYPRRASGKVWMYGNDTVYSVGKRVAITAVPKSWYVFDKWIGGKTADSRSAVTTFNMDSNMTITAHFRPIAYGMLSDKRDGRTYKTVKTPDGMVWMAENLNYAPSKGNGWIYRNNTAYSDKYGRLYDWPTAQTACPEGWRLPTRREWDGLGAAVGGKRRVDSDGKIIWRGAGRKLKALSGWGKYNNRSSANWNGTDDYGFSALPGGDLCGAECYGGGYYGAGDDNTLSSTESGNWWTATPAPDTERGGKRAYCRRIFYNSADLEENDAYRSDGRSVRCVTGAEGYVASTGAAAYSLTVKAADGGSVSVDPVKTVYTSGEKVSVSATPSCGFVFSKWDGGELSDAASSSATVTVSSNMTVTAKFTRVTPYLAHGAFTDARDGKTYKTVQICKDVWMAENLNYKTGDGKCHGDNDSKCKKAVFGDDTMYICRDRDDAKSECENFGSICYDGNESNCKKYGRLYDFKTAEKSCPAGWHLASDKEWEMLNGYADGWERGGFGEKIGGKRLKSKSGWKKYEEKYGGYGTDDFGFSALPGGFYSSKEGFFDIGKYGGWWTVAEKGAVIREMDYRRNTMYKRSMNWGAGFSARCVSDQEGRVPPPAALTLKLTATAGGTVSASPNKPSYVAGERVTISAVPNRGYTFAKWTGGKVADTGYAVTDVIVTSNMAVAANFNKSKAPPVVYGSLTDARDGKKYETVSIGGKAWTAQNMNYETPDSSWCYGDSAVNCGKYGRLYAWNAARTACPEGWHLPTVQEWDALVKAAGGEKTAGAKLKAASGWTFFGNGWVRTGNGTDDYGFSALPGGRRSDDFYDISREGYWWTATEDEKQNDRAHYRKMKESSAEIKWGYYGENIKRNGLSVRCVIDEAAPYKLTLTAATGGSVSADPAKASYRVGEKVAITAVPERGYVFAKWTGGKTADSAYAATTVTMKSDMAVAAYFNKSAAPPAAYDTLTDSRDGKKYKTAVIGGKRWMAENLNYQTPEGSWCYDRKTDNCAKYGRLYNWGMARKACPAGWHLPTRDEWKELVAAAGGEKAADKRLKSTSGWKRAGNGADVYGFSALPGGYRDDHDIKFEDIGSDGYWWTATEEECKSDIGAYIMIMTSDSGKVIEDTYYKRDGYSARCVMDDDGKLTLIAGTGGTAKASNKVNGQITITAAPNSGYAFAGWSGGLVADVAAETTTVVVNANMTIAAKFRNLFPGVLSDKRDGKKYKTVKIGRNRWMAENLNYKPSGGGAWCYENDDSYCDEYGRLYDWEAAMKVCPAGWHLPSRAEWDSLAATAGGWHYIQQTNSEYGISWYNAGGKLKSKTGWNQRRDEVNTDNVGFSALPGGYRNIEYPEKKDERESFNFAGAVGFWWSSAQKNRGDAFSREMDNITTNVFSEDAAPKKLGYSVRCVANK